MMEKRSDVDNMELIDQLEELIYVSDPETYELYYVNRDGLKMLESKEYKGRKCYQLIQNREKPCDFCKNALLNKEEYFVWEYTNQKTNRHYLVKDKLIQYRGKPARLELAVDITDKENVSRRIQKKLNMQESLLKCLAILNSESDIEKSVLGILEEITMFYQADSSCFLENDPKEEKNTFYEWGTEDSQKMLPYLNGIWKNHEFSKNLNQNKLILLEGQKEIQTLFSEDVSQNLISRLERVILFPFQNEGKINGFLSIYNPRNPEKERFLLESLSYFMTTELYKKKMEHWLEYIMCHDSLTGIPNRNEYKYFLQNIDADEYTSFGVVFLDLNGLKTLNNEYGHEYGDKLLKDTADILRAIWQGEKIFRLSGDEFIVFCENKSREYFVKKAIELKNETTVKIGLGISIGYTWEDHHIDIRTLIRRADELMNFEKQEFYQKRLTQGKRHAPVLLDNLLLSIQNREYEMFLQPKADVRTSKIIGAEALARQNHPIYGRLTPDKFIYLLEADHSIQYLDLFIFEEVCKFLSEQNKKGNPLFPISLNFSRLTVMEPNLLDKLKRILQKYDFPLHYIEIEITETIGKMERENMILIGKLLKEEGFLLSLDDFGAEYTNISLLAVMDVDVLKLDRSLIDDLVDNSKNQIIVQNMINTCRDLGVSIVAEGVETQEQLNLLKRMNCDSAQGYLFSKPIPLSQFVENYLSPINRECYFEHELTIQ